MVLGFRGFKVRVYMLFASASVRVQEKGFQVEGFRECCCCNNNPGRTLKSKPHHVECQGAAGTSPVPAREVPTWESSGKIEALRGNFRRHGLGRDVTCHSNLLLCRAP